MGHRPDEAHPADWKPSYGRLRRWAHMLGFGGHFATKSRRYSTTRQALKLRAANGAAPVTTLAAPNTTPSNTLRKPPSSSAPLPSQVSATAAAATDGSLRPQPPRPANNDKSPRKNASSQHDQTIPIYSKGGSNENQRYVT
ncbi:MAG: replication initiator [Pseudonocardiaceae bacterium]